MTERQALLVAVAGHLLLLGLLSLAVRQAPALPAEGDVIPVELVAVGDATTAPDPAPPRPSPPTPMPAPLPTTQLASRPDATPQAQPDLGPARPPDLPDPSVQDLAAREPSRFDAGAIERLIDRSLRRVPARPAAGRAAEAGGTAAGRPDPRVLASLEAAIRAQIFLCWNPPAGGADVQDMTVVLRIRLHRDGSLAAPPEFVSQTGASEGNAAYARAFVEAARRAVLRCTPLQLPPDLYSLWREFELNFDPRLLT
ncbi:MAG: TonB C-terminal domain-containing protein [Sphingomonadaceae bacterium]|uniref:hypothetical protein n=1 Tax=Thermaurantiacus sp. TaxID=2820283 RepID=UPI00298F3D09|nr:hypothetical protein [Thermaurantiacus sp.]MCS6986203.1 TonB C-terminal domain-containing protein [Sphingomonadaceae bacterium]MDW8415860.1 hypothetical protein [Thermaurantiacus sp.]